MKSAELRNKLLTNAISNLEDHLKAQKSDEILSKSFRHNLAERGLGAFYEDLDLLSSLKLVTSSEFSKIDDLKINYLKLIDYLKKLK